MFAQEDEDGEEDEEHVVHTPEGPSPELEDEGLQVEVIADDLEFPTSMAFLDDNDILVLEKDTGIVHRVIDGELQDDPALDVEVANNNERGLLGIAVSDAGDDATDVFLYFTESGGGEDGDDWQEDIEPEGNRLYRYEMSSGDEDGELQDEELLLDLPATPGPRYNGGPVLIGPDSNVYVIIGDVDAHETEAQNFEDGPEPDGTSGILRVTPDGEVEGILGDEDPLNLYYAYGIRNSFGMDFDPVTGNLWDTENGPATNDEINLVEPGFNSGWRDVQGFEEDEDVDIDSDLVDFDGAGEYSDPEFVWSEPVGVTALKFLDSAELGEEYENDMFVGDFNDGTLYRFDLNEERTELAVDDTTAEDQDDLEDAIFGTGFGAITDIEVGPDGNLYVLSFHEDQGTIFRITLDS